MSHKMAADCGVQQTHCTLAHTALWALQFPYGREYKREKRLKMNLKQVAQQETTSATSSWLDTADIIRKRERQRIKSIW